MKKKKKQLTPTQSHVSIYVSLHFWTSRAPFGRDSTCPKRAAVRCPLIDPRSERKESSRSLIFPFLRQGASCVETWGQDGRKESGTSARPWTTVFFIPRESSRRAELVFVRLRGGRRIGRTKGGEGWRASRAAWSRWAIYRPHSSSLSSSASSTMSTCSSVGKRILPSLFLEGERRWFSCSRLDRVIATAYAHSPGLSTISQFRRYYQIRTALRVSPKLPVKVEVNQLRNREYTPFEFSVSIERGGWG